MEMNVAIFSLALNNVNVPVQNIRRQRTESTHDNSPATREQKYS